MPEKQEHKGCSRLPFWLLLLICTICLVCTGIIFAIYTFRVMASMKAEMLRDQRQLFRSLQTSGGNENAANYDDYTTKQAVQQVNTSIDESYRHRKLRRSTKTTELSRGVTEAIHVVGDGSAIGESDYVQHVARWSKKDNKQGDITYSKKGFIHVARKGYYFVYSQLYYCSSGIREHITKINDKGVMKSAVSVEAKSKYNFNTQYHGGVFLLQQNDNISVYLPFTTCVKMNPERSFFGAFMINPIG